MYTELAQYHKSNPDRLFAGCQNTQQETDGVVFPGVEVLIGHYCFIGRPSLLEGMAAMYGLTPDEVHARLAAKPEKPSRTPKKDAKIA